MAGTVKKKVTAQPKTPAKKTAGRRRTGLAIVTHEAIEKLAHRFWAERGHQVGQPELDWFRAEQELRGKAS